MKPATRQPDMLVRPPTTTIAADLNIDAEEFGCDPYKVVIDCLGNNLCFEKFPYPLKNVTGRITVTRDNIELRDFTAAELPNLPGQTNTAKIEYSAFKSSNIPY